LEEDALNIVIAAVNPWSRYYAMRFCADNSDIHVSFIREQHELEIKMLEQINPEYIFFPHWSWHIPAEIYENYTCIIFHPSDVPFGRGGTPVQNLIMAGHTETVVSAIVANGEIDAGDILLKRKMSLFGGGEEILLRIQSIIFEDMIPYILNNEITPLPQIGEIVAFARRAPEMSEIPSNMTISQMFDHIRMLDISGYPKAFVRFGNYTMTFSRPMLKSGGIEADVKITAEDEHL
jgi:methionyl-tRNA formyltransferase